MIEQPPICGCGAGFCRLDAVAVGGPNFGRKFYACPIKKGQGACSFFLWQDAGSSAASSGLKSGERYLSPVSTLTDFTTISHSDSGFVTKGQHNHLEQGNASYSSVKDSSLKSKEHVLISPVSSTNIINISPDVTENRPNNSVLFESQGSNNQLLKSALLKRSNIRFEEPRECEDKFDEIEPLTRKSKRLRQGNFDDDGSLRGSSSISQHIVPLENSRNILSSRSSELVSDSHHEETTGLTAYDNLLSSCQSSSSLLIDFEIFRHSCWTLTEMGETLRNQVQGWWGRLAFPPSKCLTEPAQKPYFCCIFPSFNPIFVPPNVYQLKEAADPDPPAELASSQGNSWMKKLASKALTKAALQLKADLLGILRPLDIKDHQIMTQEANTAFAALDRLGTDHTKFKKQVTEFIQNASLLAKIDQSLSTNCSSEKLNDRLNRKNQKLTEIKDAQEKFTGALSVSTQRATRLAEEISRLKDKLLEAEADLSRCSSETAVLKVRVLQISKDRVKSEHSVKKTHDRLKDALRIRKAMEAEKMAARAAFDEAKMLLLGCKDDVFS